MLKYNSTFLREGFDLFTVSKGVTELIGTLSNEDGNVNDDGSEKSHFWFAFYFFVWMIKLC